MEVLANSGALDEISNGDDGSMIEQRTLMAGSQGGLVEDGVTRKSMLFVVYQTRRYGPLNGFHVALVLKGARVAEARERSKGVLEEDAEEFVVVEP